LGRESARDQGEHAIGREPHDPLDHVHDHRVEIVEEVEHVLAARARHRHGDAEKQRKDDDLQHVAFGHRRHRIGRHHVDQHLGERWRFLATEGGGGLTGIEALARPDHSGKRQRDRHRDRCGRQVERQCLGADAAERPQVRQCGDPDYQRHEHQRHDHHFQRRDENRTDHLQQPLQHKVLYPGDLTQQVERDAEHDASKHGDDDLAGEPVCAMRRHTRAVQES
jgi:hypothetical protein